VRNRFRNGCKNVTQQLLIERDLLLSKSGLDCDLPSASIRNSGGIGLEPSIKYRSLWPRSVVTDCDF